jgi:hypothetical protein
MTHDNDDLVEIYAPAHGIEADRLVLLLADDGIEALARATTSSSFPANARYLLLVRASDEARARLTIEHARRDGAVSGGGEWLGAPSPGSHSDGSE